MGFTAGGKKKRGKSKEMLGEGPIYSTRSTRNKVSKSTQKTK